MRTKNRPAIFDDPVTLAWSVRLLRTARLRRLRRLAAEEAARQAAVETGGGTDAGAV